MTLRPRWLLSSLALVALLGHTAGAAERVTVAVLYFDNNSPHREYDVLQKGLADMLVTDLSQVESLQVVERDKLQKLVDELKLQRSKFFDPATAQKLGKGIGARYAVTGAVAAFDPTMRIDVRVIEVASARVVVADRVVGDRGKFFDLESQLVSKLAAALEVKLAAGSRSGVSDVSTLLQYSQGLDAADKGDLKDASKRLAEVVRTAPDFQLAKDRYADIVRRLRLASIRREGVLSSVESDLVKSIDGHLAEDVSKLDGDGKARHLGYRVARGNYLLWKLSALLAPHHAFQGPAIAPPDKLPEVRQRAAAYDENTRSLIAELRASRDASGGYPSPRIESEDQRRAESAGFKGIDKWSFVTPAAASQSLAHFLVDGETPFWGPVSLTYRPALADLDRAQGGKALALAEAAEKEIKGEVDRREEKLDGLVDAIDLHAELLVALGRKEEAIAQWQRVLDGYPTAHKYKELEKKIEDLLALSPEATQFATALETCSHDLWSLMLGGMTRAHRQGGMKGVRKQADQVIAACGHGQMGLAFSASAWQFAAMEALKAGDCGYYQELKKAALAAGNNLAAGLVRTAGNACGESLPEMNR